MADTLAYLRQHCEFNRTRCWRWASAYEGPYAILGPKTPRLRRRGILPATEPRCENYIKKLWRRRARLIIWGTRTRHERRPRCWNTYRQDTIAHEELEVHIFRTCSTANMMRGEPRRRSIL